MSKAVRDRKAGGKPVVDYARPGAGAERDTVEYKPPLKPHPRLFAALCIVFAAWVAVLLTLYFKTVYPLRHSATATQQAVP